MKTKKRIIPILLTVLMLATVFSVAVSAESLTEVPEGYIGIYTKDDLYDVRLNMTGKYIMMNDIVFDDADYAEGGDFYNVGKGWEPIGTEATPFKGSFDGNGYDIVNLQINYPNGNYQGLFGYAHSATIKNVTLEDSNIIGNTCVGGIIGYTKYCTIVNCSNAAVVTGQKNVGGIAGYDYYSSSGEDRGFKSCVNTGDITATIEYAAGIVGMCYEYYWADTDITNCLNTGNVLSNRIACGIAYNVLDISYSYSIGNIYGNVHSYPIGMVDGEITFCYYLDTSVATPVGKGTSKSADQLRKQGTFEQWDFENTWEMCTEDYYDFPVPQGTKFLYPHVSISGNTVYGETVTASLEYVVENVDLYKYEWTVDGNAVSTEKTYTITKEDIGKTISIKAYLEDAIDDAMVSKEYVITKAEQTNTPVPATLAGKSDTSFSVNVIAGQEYSIDNENWNTTGEFTSLAPNKEYTVYTRMAETDTHFAGEAVDSSLTVTTNKSIIAGEVSIVGDAQYSKDLSADVSLVVPEGVTYKYEWRCGEKVLGTEAEYTLSSSDIGSKIYLALVADGDYTGEIKSSEIEVKAFNIANVTADAVADVQYTTKEITPEVTLFNGSALLEKDVDYTLSYEKNITAGKAQITVTGIGDYTGTKTVEFNIIPRNLSGVTFVAVTPQKYTGYEITPAVTLKFGNYTLVENVDYTVSYSNNTSVGTAEILIEGKGNFASQITKSFAIIKTSLSSAEIIFFETEFKYNGEEITPEIFVMLGSENLTVNKDYTVSYKNNILEGTATVTIIGIGGYSGSASAEFEIIGHLYGDWIERTAATCTEKGIDYRVCPGCDGEDTREVDKLGHDFSDEWTVDTEETCAEEGSKSHHCLRCSEISDVTVIPATGNHDYISVITTPATCKQAGVRTYTCTVCSDSYTEPVEIDSTNHVGGTEIRGAYAEDCGNNGYTGDTYCLGCDTKLADGTSIPATGNHDYISVITTPATCKQAGVRTYTCTVCSDSYTEPVEIDSTNHVGGTEIRGAYAEDCGNNGYTGDTYCLGCDTKLADGTSITATGNHDYISVITNSATCNQAGVRTYTCTVCSDSYTEPVEIDSTNHVGGTEIRGAYAEDCGNNGYTGDTYCLGCDTKLADGTSITATGNHDYISVITNSATCNQAGVRTYTCTVCSDSYTEPVEIDSTNHVGGTEIRGAYAEDCGNNGYTGDTYCLGCDTKLADGTSIPATGNHDYISVITNSATCNQAGVRTYTCTVCSDSYTEPVEIDSTNHVGGTEIRGAYAEDCGNNGYTGDTYCLGCDTKLADGTSIPATGNHDYISVITNSATCNQAGVRTYTCTVCGDTYVEETPALGHTEEVISGKSATCTETGLTEGKKCSVCNEILVAQSEISALGHKEETIAGKPATCTESGISDGIKCSVCGETLIAQEEIPALGHTEEVISGKSATCTETGLTESKKCSVCGEILVAQSEISALGHKEEVISGKSATCTETGLTEGKKCSVCGEILAEQEEIPATGHAYGEWTVVKNPTITEEGSEERTCASCGKAETRTIEKLSYLAGDINRDGKITAADARLALRIAAKLDNATEYQSIVADMNQDKKITAADARKILRISAKLE